MLSCKRLLLMYRRCTSAGISPEKQHCISPPTVLSLPPLLPLLL
jgi:hypothetical protein